MKPEWIEAYKFHKLWSIDFDDALHTIKISKKYSDPGIKHILLINIIVSYVRPFSENKGVLRARHRFKERHVPKEYLPLHKEFIDLRNRIIAHTDISARSPQVVNWSSENKKWFPLAFKNYANEFMRLRESFEKIEKMITAVNNNLNVVIDKLEDEYLADKQK